MKDRPIGRLDVIGIDACKGFLPENAHLAFRETDEIKGALAVTDGNTVYGFVTGNYAALVKTLISLGDDVYCVKKTDKTVNASKICVVDAYRKYKKI